VKKTCRKVGEDGGAREEKRRLGFVWLGKGLKGGESKHGVVDGDVGHGKGRSTSLSCEGKEEEDLVVARRGTGQEGKRPPSGLRKGKEKEREEMGCLGWDAEGGIGSRE
jgi:hypothetical protein